MTFTKKKLPGKDCSNEPGSEKETVRFFRWDL